MNSSSNSAPDEPLWQEMLQISRRQLLAMEQLTAKNEEIVSLLQQLLAKPTKETLTLPSLEVIAKPEKISSYLKIKDSASTESFKIRARQNGVRKRFKVFRRFYPFTSKSILGFPTEDQLMLKGRFDNVSWKGKLYLKSGDVWITKAWGMTRSNRRKHKFNQQEAMVAQKLLDRKLEYDEKTNTYYLLLNDDYLDLIKAWIVFYDQLQ